MLDQSYESWRQVLDIDLDAVFTNAQIAAQRMIAAGKSGSIVNTASIAGFGATKGLGAYAVAKGGVLQLTRAMALEFGARGIRVNAIAPGAGMTEKQRQLWYPTEDSVTAMVERQAIRRVLLGEEIARAVLFLAADDSRMITKQSITVDAGIR
eukprot:gene26724-biopygen15940